MGDHGDGGYRSGCRCDVCTAAWAAYHRDRYDRLKDENPERAEAEREARSSRKHKYRVTWKQRALDAEAERDRLRAVVEAVTAEVNAIANETAGRLMADRANALVRWLRSQLDVSGNMGGGGSGTP